MIEPHYRDESVTLYHGDSLDVLAALEPGSIDAVVTDPPYGLEFMGREWDRPWAVSAANGVGYAGRDDLRLPAHGDSRNAHCRACGGRQRGAKRCTCDRPQWDRNPADDMRAFGDWCVRWTPQCLRVLKPGGHLLAFGGTRTWHRLTCAIEDAGFEIRDTVAWIHGQGFPKSQDVSKAIDKAAGVEREIVSTGRAGASSLERVRRVDMGYRDKLTNVAPEAYPITAPATDEAFRWQGWGTALKPAHEPIVVARKPLAGTVAQNVLNHGTGALNVDGCRVPSEPIRTTRGNTALGMMNDDGWRPRPAVFEGHDAGRWPTNVVLDEAAAAELDRQSGTLTSGANPARRGSDKFRDTYGDFAGQTECTPARGADSGGASRFFPVFRYEPKADSAERPRVDGVAHPTVKPLDLMRWLVRLVTPPGGLVLDPFAGSGTTGEACVVEGFRCTLVEREPDYLPLILARLAKGIQPVLDLDT